MTDLKKLIEEFSRDYFEEIKKIENQESLEFFRVKFIGRSGLIIDIVKKLKELSGEEKRELGPVINKLKQDAKKAFEEKKAELEGIIGKEKIEKKKFFDVTAYKNLSQGSLHIYSKVEEEIENLFISMGFKIAFAPEVETPFYNFEALNIPETHPARDLQDTFWLKLPGYLMRTHTSSIQIREMLKSEPPIKICAPGNVYRQEATDATHDFVFRQVEGLVVDKDVSIANLMGLIQELLRAIFKDPDLKIRARTSYFPFVEPGLEVDMSCPFCEKGCFVCKKTKWIEMGGAGLVHPNVLKACNIDPEKWTGCAFGFGIERMAMLKHQINDVRLFKSNKLGFLKQF